MMRAIRRASLLAIVLATVFMAMTYLSLGGVSAVTLPWFTISVVFLSLAVIIGMYGRVIIPLLIGKFVKVPIGRGYVTDHYVIFEKPVHEDNSVEYAGFSVVKVIPTIPVTDLDEKERLQLIGQIESLFLAMPFNVEYGILKVVDPRINELKDKIRREIEILESKKSRNPAKYERRINELNYELKRLQQSNPVSAIIYFKVIAYGKDEDEVKKKLDIAISQIKALKMALQADIMVLNLVDLIEFMRLQLTGYGAEITGL